MSFAFDRPIGSHGDVTELDYIAALHQTDVPGGLRKDGSIKGEHHARTCRVMVSTPSRQSEMAFYVALLIDYVQLIVIDVDISLFLSSRYGK